MGNNNTTSLYSAQSSRDSEKKKVNTIMTCVRKDQLTQEKNNYLPEKQKSQLEPFLEGAFNPLCSVLQYYTRYSILFGVRKSNSNLYKNSTKRMHVCLSVTIYNFSIGINRIWLPLVS